MQQMSDKVCWNGLLDKHLDQLQVKAENEEKKAQAKRQQLALIRDQLQRIDSSVKAKADSTESDPSAASSCSSSSVRREKSKEDDRARSRSPRQRTMMQAEAQ